MNIYEQLAVDKAEATHNIASQISLLVALTLAYALGIRVYIGYSNL